MRSFLATLRGLPRVGGDRPLLFPAELVHAKVTPRGRG